MLNEKGGKPAEWFIIMERRRSKRVNNSFEMEEVSDAIEESKGQKMI